MEKAMTPRRAIRQFIQEKGDAEASRFFGLSRAKMRQCAANPMTITSSMLQRWAEAAQVVETAAASGTDLEVGEVPLSPEAKPFVDPVLSSLEQPESEAPSLDLGLSIEEQDSLVAPAEQPAPHVPRVESVPQAVDSGWEWKGRDVAILCPWYKSTNPATHFALMALFDRSRMQYMMELGDAMIYHSRNRLADRFLASGCEWALWLDDDMIPPIGNASWLRAITGLDIPPASAGLNVIEALMSHRKSIVAAAYMGRRRGASLMLRTPGGNTERPVQRLTSGDPPLDSSRILACDWVATGCMLTHRSVFESIRKRFPSLAPKTAREPWNYFLPIAERGNLEGEDVAFCRRAREAGHIPFVDLACLAAHVGYQAFVPGVRL